MTSQPDYLISSAKPSVWLDRLRPRISEIKLKPFPLFCAALCVETGRLRTLQWRGQLAAVVIVRENTRSIVTSEDCNQVLPPSHISIPRRERDKKKFLREARMRRLQRRERKVFTAPCWTNGEPSEPARVVALESLGRHLGADEQRDLTEKLGFPTWALGRSQMPAYRYQRPSRAKKRMLLNDIEVLAA